MCSDAIDQITRKLAGNATTVHDSLFYCQGEIASSGNGLLLAQTDEICVFSERGIGGAHLDGKEYWHRTPHVVGKRSRYTNVARSAASQ